MKNFSAQSLMSVPYSINHRKLSAQESDYVISLLTFLDVFTNEYTSTYPREEIEKSFTYEMRRALREKWLEDKTIIDACIEKHSAQFDDATKLLLSSWKYAIKDRFICVKYFPDYAVFLSIQNKEWFAVRALGQDFTEIVQRPTPYCIDTILLPFFDSIVWDGLLAMVNIDFDRISTMQMVDTCKQIRRHNGLIHQLVEFKKKEKEEISSEETPSVEAVSQDVPSDTQ